MKKETITFKLGEVESPPWVGSEATDTRREKKREDLKTGRFRKRAAGETSCTVGYFAIRERRFTSKPCRKPGRRGVSLEQAVE